MTGILYPEAGLRSGFVAAGALTSWNDAYVPLILSLALGVEIMRRHQEETKFS
jgi:hypothetical protein